MLTRITHFLKYEGDQKGHLDHQCQEFLSLNQDEVHDVNHVKVSRVVIKDQKELKV